MVQRLGGVVTDKARECTHMVATRVTRTVKFLSGISVCDHIVTPEWVEQSGRGVGFVEEGAFALCDQNTEQMFGMNLTTSLARAKEKKLLKVRSEVKVHCQRLNYEACDDTLGYLWESSPFLSPSFLLPFVPSHPPHLPSVLPLIPPCVLLPQGFCFHSTPHVQPPHNSFKEIIECAGGEVSKDSLVPKQPGYMANSEPQPLLLCDIQTL